MKLFCLPYAGGSETIYYRWRTNIDESIQIVPIELKGRGKRYNEKEYDSILEAIDDIYNSIEEEIENDEYAIYGHSMGSLLAYELYYKICEMKKRKPKHIFFSGYGAPNTVVKGEEIHGLPDNEFMEKIMEMGGSPRELMENKELFQLFLPILKNDMRILEKYLFKPKEAKMECDISILTGNEEKLKPNQIIEWRKHTEGKCKMYTLSGNHFFINTNMKNITNLINQTL